MQSGSAGSSLLHHAASSPVAQIRGAGREKLVGGEFNAPEQLAGIVAGRHAFLFRDTEVVGRNQHLHIAHDLYDDEQADGGVDRIFALAALKDVYKRQPLLFAR